MPVEHLRFAARNLVRARGFTVTAALTLALGIGLSTAVFTVADALWIRRLPIADQDRVVALWGQTRDRQFTNFPVSLDAAREFGRRTHTLERTGFFGYEGASLKTVRNGDRVYRLTRALVSGNYFDVLGSRPLLGRTLRPEDDVPGATPVLVLSHRAWKGRFAGDSAVVGRSITMLEAGVTYTIVGVMPQGLDYPTGADTWAPLVASSSGTGDSLHLTFPALDLVGRLRPGASLGEARAEFSDYMARVEAPLMHTELTGVVHTLPDLVLGDTKPALIVVIAAAALLLCVTCVNVANLLLVRSLGRARELAVRSALGASRARIAGELLVESALLSLAGALLGSGAAVAIVHAFVSAAPPALPRLDEIAVNLRAFGGAFAITAAAMLLFGMTPSLVTSRVDSANVLHSGARVSGGRRLRAATEVLVAGQIAVAIVVLLAAGLMTKSLIKLQRIDLSFEPDRLLVAELVLRHDRLGDQRKPITLIEDIVRRVQSLPGVAQVSPVLFPPFAGTGSGVMGRLSTAAQTPEQVATNPMLDLEVVAPNYFATLAIPVLRGRAFSNDDREGGPAVVVVSQSTARHYWPSGDAIGQRFQMPGNQFTVVGVVPDTRYRELRKPIPAVYFPIRQSFFPVVPTTLLVRTSGAPADLIAALRRAISEADRGVTLATA
ncbi:MAG TPA: ABC transporter permease, partial [Gemmatimonadaceae bacterium]|nr:ABC transporter permease [Gemmatimonadaceae bacterium]